MVEPISFIGAGSLLCERSARNTCPSINNFRIAKVVGYKRIFNQLNSVLIKKYSPEELDMYISSCGIYPCENTTMYVTVFDFINPKDWQDLQKREDGYTFVQTTYTDIKTGQQGQATMCLSDYKSEWVRDDILPIHKYMRHCLRAAALHGEDFYNNFLDTSFLGDGITPIREYLSQTDLPTHGKHDLDFPNYFIA